MKAAAETEDNLVPLIITCVENYATLGEISETLKEIFGVYRPNQ